MAQPCPTGTHRRPLRPDSSSCPGVAVWRWPRFHSACCSTAGSPGVRGGRRVSSRPESGQLTPPPPQDLTWSLHAAGRAGLGCFVTGLSGPHGDLLITPAPAPTFCQSISPGASSEDKDQRSGPRRKSATTQKEEKYRSKSETWNPSRKPQGSARKEDPLAPKSDASQPGKGDFVWISPTRCSDQTPQERANSERIRPHTVNGRPPAAGERGPLPILFLKSPSSHFSTLPTFPFLHPAPISPLLTSPLSSLASMPETHTEWLAHCLSSHTHRHTQAVSPSSTNFLSN